MDNLKKEKFLNKKLRYISCYEPGGKRVDFELKYKFIPRLIDDLKNIYNKKIKNIYKNNKKIIKNI